MVVEPGQTVAVLAFVPLETALGAGLHVNETGAVALLVTVSAAQLALFVQIVTLLTLSPELLPGFNITTVLAVQVLGEEPIQVIVVTELRFTVMVG